jgi:gliding motility-associated-like protein
VAVVTINVADSDGCNIPSVITPNGDDVNDVFFIPCLGCADCLQDNELTIFNQWGDQVFHSEPYLQNWDGTDSGNPLPPGTYFYVLKYNSSAVKENKTGFIIIQR